MQPGTKLGFNFGVPNFGIPGMSGAITPDALRADATLRREILRSDVQLNDRVELFVYFMNHPSLDRWVWDRIYRNLERWISDQDATKPAKFWSLNPELNFVVTNPSTATDESKTIALLEVLRRYFCAIHFMYASAVQAMNWANMRGFPIAERAMGALKVTTLNQLLMQLNGFPMCSAVMRYILTQQRILEFRPEPGVLIHAYPLYIYEGHTYMEAADSVMATLGWSTRSVELPTLTELSSPGLTLSDYTGTSSGMVINYIYNSIVRAKTYLLETLGFSDSVLKISSKLREFFSQTGVLDSMFDFDQLIKDVNGLPLYDGWDFTQKMLIHADRPRPIMKHNVMPFGIINADAELAVFPHDPLNYIWSDRSASPKVLSATGILADRYEYLTIPSNHVNFGAVINSGDWSMAGVVPSVAAAGERSSIGVLVSDWLVNAFKPYQSFYLPSPDAIDPEKFTYGEQGLISVVSEELGAGIFMPRYIMMPTIDNMDPMQCGFYKVLMNEWRQADPWSLWAMNYFHGAGSWSKNPWSDTYTTLGDCLLWVGSQFNVAPERALVHPLAAQTTYFKGGADARRIATNAGDLASNTLGAVPFVPFIYNFVSRPVARIVGATTDKWDPELSQWDGTDEPSQATLDHTLSELSGSRENLWSRALFYFDPTRPYQVRFANYITSCAALFRERIEQAVDNIGSIFTNVPVNTVPFDKDNSRYISSYRLMNTRRPPLTAADRELVPGAGLTPMKGSQGVQTLATPSMGKPITTSAKDRGSGQFLGASDSQIQPVSTTGQGVFGQVADTIKGDFEELYRSWSKGEPKRTRELFMDHIRGVTGGRLKPPSPITPKRKSAGGREADRFMQGNRVPEGKPPLSDEAKKRKGMNR